MAVPTDSLAIRRLEEVLENISMQLSELEVAQSIWPDELQVDEDTVARLQEFVEAGGHDGAVRPPLLSFTLCGLALSTDSDGVSEGGAMKGDLVFSFSHKYPNEAPAVSCHMHNAACMPRKAQDCFVLELTKHGESLAAAGETAQVYDIVLKAQELAPSYISHSTATKDNDEDASKNVTFVREWIFFPMIRTREKRDHILDWAPAHCHGITGFLLAGKPGMMCLEGVQEEVASFVQLIRTESWKDVPAGHRKMTSRLTEPKECTLGSLDSCRSFTGMTELERTDSLDDVRAFLKQHDMEERFFEVFPKSGG